MIYGITNGGFIAKPQSQIITDMTTSFLSTFGQNTNVSTNSLAGQIIGIMSEPIAEVWQNAEAIYNDSYPNSASGTALDNAQEYRGVTRIGQSTTTVNVMLSCNASTTVPGTSTKVTSSLPNFTGIFEQQADAVVGSTIGSGCTVNIIVIDVNGSITAMNIVSSGSGYFLNEVVEVNQAANTTNNDSALFQVTSIGTGGSVTGILLMINGTGYRVGNSVPTTGTFNIMASYSATVPGSQIVVNPGTIDTIVTPVSGLNAVSNPNAGVTGNDEQTDDTFRVAGPTGTGITPLQLENLLIQTIPGIIPDSVSVTPNPTAGVVNGIAPYGAYIVADGPIGQTFEKAVCNAIWNANGFTPTTGSITNAITWNGQTYYVSFNRPTIWYPWVNITQSLYTVYNQSQYPGDVVAQSLIANAIVAWGNSLPPGSQLYIDDYISIILGLQIGIQFPISSTIITQAQPTTVLPLSQPSYPSAYSVIDSTSFSSSITQNISLSWSVAQITFN